MQLLTEPSRQATKSDASEPSARELEKLLKHYAGYQSMPVKLNCHNETEQIFRSTQSPLASLSLQPSNEGCEDHEMARIQVEEPCRRIRSAGLGRTMPAPKRFYRSFWQSLSRRILKSRMCISESLMMELEIHDSMMEIDT